MSKDETGYNGWANYETWNVALWIGNDEGLYNFARSYRNQPNPYEAFVADMRDLDYKETPDGVAYNDSGLDVDALNEMIEEL